jgi:hypothetical protein
MKDAQGNYHPGGPLFPPGGYSQDPPDPAHPEVVAPLAHLRKMLERQNFLSGHELQIIDALYHNMRQRRVEWPFSPPWVLRALME